MRDDINISLAPRLITMTVAIGPWQYTNSVTICTLLKITRLHFNEVLRPRMLSLLWRTSKHHGKAALKKAKGTKALGNSSWASHSEALILKAVVVPIILNRDTLIFMEWFMLR